MAFKIVAFLVLAVAVAPDALRDDLIAARDYEIQFDDFDWQLNAALEPAG